MTSDKANKLGIAVPGEWVAQKLLGPALDEIGNDLQKLYSVGRDKILAVAIRKSDIKDGKRANLRVTRDVFWNGSFTDEAICAEYFGGILAASRSKDGRNDTGVFFVDIIKSMSAGHLKTHYIIYRTLNKELLANDQKSSLNPGQETELGREEIFLPLAEVSPQLAGEDIGAVLHGLRAKNLIGNFQTDHHLLEDGKSNLPYLKVQPTSLGVQLFAIANNKFSDWRRFSSVDFGDFEGIRLPLFFAPSLDTLLERAGLKKENSKEK